MSKRSRKSGTNKADKLSSFSRWWAKYEGLSDFVKTVTALGTVLVAILSLSVFVTFFKSLDFMQDRFPGLRYVLSTTVHDSPNRAIDLRIPLAWGPLFGDIKYDQTLRIGEEDDSVVLGPGINAVENNRIRWWRWEDQSGVYLSASKALPNVTAAEITDDNAISDADVDPDRENPPDLQATAASIEEIDDALIRQVAGRTGTHCQSPGEATQYDRPDELYHIYVIDWSDCRYNIASPPNYTLTGFAVRPIDRQTAQANGEDFVAVGLITQLSTGDSHEAKEILNSFKIRPGNLPDPSLTG